MVPIPWRASKTNCQDLAVTKTQLPHFVAECRSGPTRIVEAKIDCLNLYINCRIYRDIPFIYPRPGLFLLHLGPSPGVKTLSAFFFCLKFLSSHFYPLVVIFFPKKAAGRDMFFSPQKTQTEPSF